MSNSATFEFESTLLSNGTNTKHYDHSTVYNEYAEAIKGFQFVAKRAISLSSALIDSDMRKDFGSSKTMNTIASEVNQTTVLSIDKAEKNEGNLLLCKDLTTHSLSSVQFASTNKFERESLNLVENMESQTSAISQIEVEKGNCT